jgi:hypothetical protein
MWLEYSLTALAGFVFILMIGVQTQLLISDKHSHLYILFVWTIAQNTIWCLLIHKIAFDTNVIFVYSIAAAAGAVVAAIVNRRIRENDRNKSTT